jgi:hypothetical protein
MTQLELPQQVCLPIQQILQLKMSRIKDAFFIEHTLPLQISFQVGGPAARLQLHQQKEILSSVVGAFSRRNNEKIMFNVSKWIYISQYRLRCHQDIF